MTEKELNRFVSDLRLLVNRCNNFADTHGDFLSKMSEIDDKVINLLPKLNEETSNFFSAFQRVISTFIHFRSS